MTLEVVDLHHRYGARVTLRGVSFTLPVAGSLTALIGPNAAGKSTLFRALAGMIRPVSGRMLLDGANIAALPVRARTRIVGFMPQTFTSTAALSVFEVVMLARK
jgi:iron complex transport system ATP-binding protein